jgi:hypothetical protein
LEIAATDTKILEDGFMLRQFVAATFGALVTMTVPVLAGDEEIIGTWKLISSQRHILETGQKLDTWGPNPIGFISYGKDGRMMTLIVRSERPKPEAVTKVTDQQSIDLFKSMFSYGGTYKFHGDHIEHFIDISYNEALTGTTFVRDVKRDGELLVYTTRPVPFYGDGKMSVNTLVWEKVK